jgi:hypothetical protein
MTEGQHAVPNGLRRSYNLGITRKRPNAQHPKNRHGPNELLTNNVLIPLQIPNLMFPPQMLHQIPYITTDGVRNSPPCTQRTRKTTANTVTLHHKFIPDQEFDSPGAPSTADHDDLPRLIWSHGNERAAARTTTVAVSVEGG